MILRVEKIFHSYIAPTALRNCLEDHGELGSLLGLLQLLLRLAELGQVEGSNLLGLLDLLLVGLDLALQLAGQLRHAVLVLLVLTLGEGQLLGLALGPLEGLGGLTSAALGGGQLSLQLAQSVGQRVLASSKSGHMLLLSTELISQAGSVNHGLLGLLLGILGSHQHTVNLGLEGVDAGLQLALAGHVTAIDGLHVVDSSTGVSDVILQLSDGTVGSIKQSLALLHLTRQSGSFALRDANLLNNLGLGASLILESLDGLTKLSLVALDGLQTLRVGLVGMVQSNLKLVDLSLELLLDTESLTLGSLLSLNGGSKRLHGAGMVLPGVVELLLLLSHTSVNLLSDIGKLQLGAEDSVLLHLKSGLGLLQSTLELLLLLLQHAALFVQSVDGAAALTKLVEQILDLISQVLVLTLDNIQLLHRLLLGGLQAEQLRGVVASLILGGSNLSSKVSGLGLPLTQNLVKVLGALLSDQSSSMHSLVLHGDVIQVSSKSALGLLGIGNLGAEDINKLLILDNLGLQLVASSLKLLNAAHALSLQARLPQLDLSLGLGQSLERIRLAHGLILQLLPHVLKIGGHHLVLGEQRGSVLGLGIRQSLSVLQLGGDRDLGLVHVGNGILKLLNLPVKVLVLNLETLLGGLSLIESSGHLVKPSVGVHNGGLEQLALLVKLSLALDSILQIQTSITQVKLKTSLVLLRLDLAAIEAVNLLTKISHGVVVLHAESGQGSLLSNVELLKLSLQSSKLSLTLLVKLNLGGSVGTSLLQAGGD